MGSALSRGSSAIGIVVDPIIELLGGREGIRRRRVARDQTAVNCAVQQMRQTLTGRRHARRLQRQSVAADAFLLRNVTLPSNGPADVDRLWSGRVGDRPDLIPGTGPVFSTPITGA
jgi:hypothetical protein